MVAVCIVWTTYRATSGFAWFADSLARQIGNDDIEVVAVDALYAPERRAQFNEIVKDRFPFRHLLPMPSPFRGPCRRTQHQYFAASGGRNTGVVCARAPYIVFVDDAGLLMPGWWPAAREAAQSGIVVTGAFQKRWGMIVKDGRLVASRAGANIDSRWNLGRDDLATRIDGAQCYGASIGVPRQMMLDLNGFDELCDGTGGEDFQLGIRIERAGTPIYYHRGMLTVESEELHRIGAPLKLYDPSLDEDSYMRRLSEFSVMQRAGGRSFDASAMIVDLAYGASSSEALGNYYALRELDEAKLSGIIDRFPTHHWFNGCPLATISPTQQH